MATKPQLSNPFESVHQRVIRDAEKAQADAIQLILENLRKCDPYRFENIAVDVLIAMGYGIRGEVTRRSGDNGIDGILYLDSLGFEKIYVQAKRVKKPVGSPFVRDFAGALHLRKGRKGVIVSTSGFTRNAYQCAEHLDVEIVFLGGIQLAEYLYHSELAAETTNRIEIKTIRPDYFIEDSEGLFS